MTRRRKAGRWRRTPPLGLAGGIADVASARAARPEPSGAAGSPPTAKPRPGRAAHPVLDLLGQRAAVSVFTLFVVSVLVFLATEVLPGNAANAVLGRTAAASPVALHRLEAALHLNRGLADQYWLWLSGLFTGNLGHSLVNGQPVWGYVEPRLIDSAVLMGVSGVIGAVAGVAPGARAAPCADWVACSPPSPRFSPLSPSPRCRTSWSRSAWSSCSRPWS